MGLNPQAIGVFLQDILRQKKPRANHLERNPRRTVLATRSFRYLGELIAGSRKMHVFHCELEDEIETLSLMEGEEIGVFLPKEIEEKQLYSKKRKSCFPITEISYGVFNKFGRNLKCGK